MTILDITHGKFRLQATPGDDGLDTVTVTHTDTGLPASLEEAKLRRVAFLHGPEGWLRMKRDSTLHVEAHLMAFHGRPRTLHDQMRVDDIVMP